MPRSRTKRRLLLALALVAFSSNAPALLGQNTSQPKTLQQKTSHTTRAQAPISEARAQLEHGDLEASEKSIWTMLSSEPDSQDARSLLQLLLRGL